MTAAVVIVGLLGVHDDDEQDEAATDIESAMDMDADDDTDSVLVCAS